MVFGFRVLAVSKINIFRQINNDKATVSYYFLQILLTARPILNIMQCCVILEIIIIAELFIVMEHCRASLR